MRYFLPILLSGGLLTAFSARATTIVPFANLADLYAASDAVVFVQAGAPYETPESACTHNDCDFTVSIALKGPMVANDVFSLRRYSHYNEFGHLDIAGDFIPHEGRTYLVFLKQNGDKWGLMMLSYYVFEQTNEFLVPVQESLGMGTAPRPDGIIAEPLTTYHKNALLELLRQQGKGKYIPWDGRSAQAALPNLDQVSDRVLPTGCDFAIGPNLIRWQNTNINVYYDATDAPADAAARIANTLATLNAAYPGLQLNAAGVTDFTPNCLGGSVSGGNFPPFASSLNGTQTTIIMFDDPCNEIFPLIACAGTLGMGGSYGFSGNGQTHTYKGDTWLNGGWGYVIINDGVRACQTEGDFERLLSHELTHTLGMDHLDAVLYLGNNMNSGCCNPINTKDQECMNYAYDLSLPVELLSFDAKAIGEEVLLTWTTAREINNDYFLIERSGDGRKFERLATIEATNVAHTSIYTLTDEQPAAGINYYRLSQADRDGTIKELAMRAVSYRGEVSGYTLVPNPVSGASIVLASRLQEPQTASLQIFSATGTMVYELTDSQKLASNRLEVPVSDLPSGIYWLKINESGRSETLKFVRQ